MTDPRRLREVLSHSGFDDPHIRSVQASVRLGDDAADATDFLLSTGPIRVNLNGLDPAELSRLRAEVGKGMKRFETPGGVCVRRKNWLVTAVTAGGPTTSTRAGRSR
ncbi:hypothetical protein [Amycolatopsis pigmentata]|uniref:Uncharacterized protein n=1 Tax=Amycolatopsis pigmentata TaxID=450801 RepID=A0ABW5FWP5_9PSEU